MSIQRLLRVNVSELACGGRRCAFPPYELRAIALSSQHGACELLVALTLLLCTHKVFDMYIYELNHGKSHVDGFAPEVVRDCG